MTVSSRHVQPCSRCKRLRTCKLLDDELRAMVTHVEDLAEFLTERTPDAEVIVDCKSFSPVKGTRSRTT